MPHERVESGRARLIGINEAVFREVNERVEAIAGSLRTKVENLQLVCECGRADCFERLEMSVTQYEALRADPTLFVVRPGHGLTDVEAVVRSEPAFEIVRKRPGQPANVAVETDPRSN